MELQEVKQVEIGGKKLNESLREEGWYLFNEAMEGEWEKEYTYEGARGCSVVDYGMVNEMGRKKIENWRKNGIGSSAGGDNIEGVG